ncbi:MAG: phosphotransferase [Alphaproteobacteria bacterium]|nr:phosphotransferase [Alphaproteobacteria bacterium]
MNRFERPIEIAAFLEQQGWGEAVAEALDGDFSPRRYARLIRADAARAILMDADPSQKTAAFVGLAGLLRGIGIEAPEIYAAAPEQGLVLMQDLGSRNVGALIDGGTAMKPFLLRGAQILARIHGTFDRVRASALDIPLYNADLFVAQADLFLDAYLPFAGQEITEEQRQDFRAAWRAVLRPIDIQPKSLLLRDFMPDNMMDLPDGKLGVLDFQDAGIGPVAYDLASLCEEVRRDGAFAFLPEVVAHYHAAAQSPVPQADLLRAATILSALRHTRILGIVAQLALKTGRREKLAYIPCIQQHLRHVLTAPYLQPVQEWMQQVESMKI